ncbi:MAG: hypothetical protein WBA74_08515 [Cyclobacteriaceae bacterium]
MKKLKTIFIIWIAIYPTITLIQFFFGEQLAEFPLMIRTFILTIILVPAMVLLLIPFWNRIFDLVNSGFRKKK